MGESESSPDESGDLLLRDCLRDLGFGVDGSPVVAVESPVWFNSEDEDAEASLFRFEADLGGGSSTKTVEFLVINTRQKTSCEHEHTRWLENAKRNTKIRHTRQVNKRHLTSDLWSGGGLIILGLGPAVSRSPALSPLLEGGLKSPEPAPVPLCVRVLRVLRAVITDDTGPKVERTR